MDSKAQLLARTPLSLPLLRIIFCLNSVCMGASHKLTEIVVTQQLQLISALIIGLTAHSQLILDLALMLVLVLVLVLVLTVYVL